MNINMDRKARIISKITKMFYVTIAIIAGLILLFITYYAFKYTHVSVDHTELYNAAKDSVLWNLLSLVITLPIMIIIKLCFSKLKSPEKLEYVMLAITLIVTTFFSFLWVKYAHIKPEGDQLLVYAMAGYVSGGNVTSLNPGGYFYMCPHQLGLAAILGILYRFFGVMKYSAFEYLNVLYIPLLVFSGYKITKLCYQKRDTSVMYLILIALCAPMYLYVPYIYGEIGSLAFSLAFVWNVLSFCQKPRWLSAVLGAICAAIAYEYRMNSIIIVIAGLLILAYFLVKKFSWKTVCFATMILVSVFSLDYVVHSVYKNYANVDEMRGIPKSLYIAMGLNENPLGPGWFSFYAHNTYNENNYDYEMCDLIGKEEIEVRLQEFIEKPAMALDFFKRKVVSQWNEPTYDTLVLTNSFELAEADMEPVIISIYRGEWYADVVEFMNRYQIIVYFFALFGVVMELLRKQKKEEQIVLWLILIGGLLFSMLWEAKSRYILPYLVFLIPMSAAGLEELVQSCINCTHKRRLHED